MLFHGRVLKGFAFGVFGLFLLFPTIPNLSSAYALTNDLQQWFDSFTAGNPVTNVASLPVTSNWNLTYTAGQNFSLSVTQFIGIAGGPVSSDTLVTYPPVVSGEPPYEYGVISSPLPTGCGSCAVTLTYMDSSFVTAGAYIMVDVLSQTQPKAFALIVTGTDGTVISSPADDILTGCKSPPATITQNTNANQWATVFMANTLPAADPVSTVQLIIPNGYAGDLDQNDGDFVYVDNLTDAATVRCLVPPTATFTQTQTPTITFTLSPTHTLTFTSTMTPTNTLSPTATGTYTPTFTATNTPTITDTSTVTSTNTPTVSPTPTLSPLPSNTFTNTSTPTNTLTSTNTPSFTSTNTYTVTPTSSSTPSYTPSFTSTYTPGSTSTSTNTWTQTFTSTASFTPTPSSTSTITFTPTNTFTFTITLTPTITNTPPPTPTPTDTPCPVNVYPNPMDYQHNPAFNNQCPSSNPCIKFSCIPPQSTLNVYTITLSLVRSFGPYDQNYTYNPSTSTGLITWDGKNGDGNPVAAGFYFYKVDGPNGQTFGKFAISRSLNGP